MDELSKQINLYSVDTKAFYTPEETNYNSIKSWCSYRIRKIKENLQVESHEFVLSNKKDILDMCKYEYKTKLIQEGFSEVESIYIVEKEFNESKSLIEYEKIIYRYLEDNHKNLNRYNKIKQKASDGFIKSINSFKGVRKLKSYHLNDKNKVALFDSALTRVLNLKTNKTTTELLLIRPYHYSILEQLVHNGYDFQGKHYILLTASAGQIRTKKCVFINEELFIKNEKTLMCGLTREKINNSNQNGMNLTKYMAYLALNNSATKLWEDFDIDKTIVIKDFETKVEGLVDYIDVSKLENATSIEECIERRKMNVPIPHSDGCGWILPTKSNKNFMVRLPWIKGLLTPCNYLEFCKAERIDCNDENRYEIIDYWGETHDLIKEDIQIVFTESQFKAIKYYKNWEEYKNYFKKYNCKANLCNIEPDTKDFRQASLNYQMLQTLTDITDEEIKYFTAPIEEYILKGYIDRKTQLDILGVNRYYKSNIQKALGLYPEMIQESYVKSLLSDNLNKKKKQAKYGKFKINAKYTFAIPDIYAWMEFAFNNDNNPKGILKHRGTVSCRLYKNNPHLTVNRSPHLSKEHGTRINVINKDTRKWFITDGCYSSSHDLLTKLLQNDNDGDKYLVIADEQFYKIAKRNMRDIVPLYYEMAKAKPKLINSKNMYVSLIEGYKYGNIGQYSNKITVMANEPEVDYNSIKILTCLNNFYIDGAKTGYMPKMSSAIKDRIKYANSKPPYFFKFAKEKEDKQVKKINNSTVNRICRNIENIGQGRFNFSHHGVFRKNVLLHDNSIKGVDQELVNYYLQLDGKKNEIYKNSEVGKHEVYNTICYSIKNDLLIKAKELNIDEIEAVDMLVYYIYNKHKNLRKTLLWDIFGEYIINNINNNLKYSLKDKTVRMCEECGKRFRIKVINSKQIYCSKCAKKINISKTIQRKQKLSLKCENPYKP